MPDCEKFDEQVRVLFAELGESRKMVLATASENAVTARTMSCVITDSCFYFQTDRASRKYHQLLRNPHAALCCENFQIEGVCRELGWPPDFPAFCSAYERHFPSAYRRYTHLSNERLFSFCPTLAKRWIYEQDEPYELVLDFKDRTFQKIRYQGT